MYCQWYYLSSSLEIGQSFLKDDEAESKESHDQAMTSITKHHSKQERECDDSVRGYIKSFLAIQRIIKFL